MNKYSPIQLIIASRNFAEDAKIRDNGGHNLAIHGSCYNSITYYEYLSRTFYKLIYVNVEHTVTWILILIIILAIDINSTEFREKQKDTNDAINGGCKRKQNN